MVPGYIVEARLSIDTIADFSEPTEYMEVHLNGECTALCGEDQTETHCQAKRCSSFNERDVTLEARTGNLEILYVVSNRVGAMSCSSNLPRTSLRASATLTSVPKSNFDFLNFWFSDFLIFFLSFNFFSK